jgi:hypothetical protein
MGKVSDAIAALNARPRATSVKEFQRILDVLLFTSKTGARGKHVVYTHAGLALDGFYSGSYNAAHDPVHIGYVKDLLTILTDHRTRLLELLGEHD